MMEKLADIEIEVRRLGGKFVLYDIDVLSINEWGGPSHYPLIDDICLMTTGEVAVPEEVAKMEMEQVAFIRAQFWGEWTRDYWGEYDANFELRSAQVTITDYATLWQKVARVWRRCSTWYDKRTTRT